jgi:murein L,D-transpeptidase YafK
MNPAATGEAPGDVHTRWMVYSFGMLFGRRRSKFAVQSIHGAMALLFALSSQPGYGITTAAADQGRQQADAILILKKDHRMELLADGKVIRKYQVALGQGGLAPKQREGDARTPEGLYVIDAKYEHSKYHKALHVSYPNAEDRRRAAKLHVAPGGAIMIHGLPNGKGWVGARHRLFDWTLGCIAVTDEEIDEVWKLVPVGTAVEIRP